MFKFFELKSKHAQGFTLIELMIAVAIIGILASIAIPSYQGSVKKSRRADAQGALMSLSNVMERHFTESNTYCDFAKTGGTAVTGCGTGTEDSGTPLSGPNRSPESGTKYYDLTITVPDSSNFTVRATPTGAQTGDGVLELTSTGVRRWDKDNSTTFSTDESKWE